jgi:adenylate cyclase, class 2
VQTEIEAKFLAVDHDVLRARLKELGATCTQPMRTMRRKHYDFPGRTLDKGKNAWVRIRDEGDKITASYKQLADRTLHGTSEVCVTVDDFDRMGEFLMQLGMESNNYQETKRESWKLGDLEIELDEWPWVKPYVEIEAPDETTLRQIVKDLGLDWAKAYHGSVEVVYTAEYDVTDEEVNTLEVVTFTPVPEWLEAKRKVSA